MQAIDNNNYVYEANKDNSSDRPRSTNLQAIAYCRHPNSDNDIMSVSYDSYKAVDNYVIKPFHVGIGPTALPIGISYSAGYRDIEGGFPAIASAYGVTPNTNDWTNRIRQSRIGQPSLMSATHHGINVQQELQYCHMRISPTLCNYRNWEIGFPRATNENYVDDFTFNPEAYKNGSGLVQFYVMEEIVTDQDNRVYYASPSNPRPTITINGATQYGYKTSSPYGSARKASYR